jgi:hypothetical protein
MEAPGDLGSSNAAITWPHRDNLNITNRLEATQVHGIVMLIMTEY